jgi:thiosulfate/3-mercaptopyruvate sulfurtransferase
MDRQSLRIQWVIAVAMFAALPLRVMADHKPASSIPETALVQPAALAAQLKAHAKTPPVILQVGFKSLFDQAHIAGAQYAGPGGQADGVALLKSAVAKLPKDAAIVIYCGCCPWSRCPNIAAAYDELQALKFSHVSVLYMADNFGADWVDHGYPVASAD